MAGGLVNGMSRSGLAGPPAVLATERRSKEPHLAWLSIEGDQLAWSDGVFDLLGLPRETFRPGLELFMSFVHLDDQHVRSMILAGPNASSPHRTTFRIVRRDGEVHVIVAVPLERRSDAEAQIIVLQPLDERDAAAPFNAGAPIDEDGLVGRWIVSRSRGDLRFSPCALGFLGLASGERINVGEFMRHVAAPDRARVAAVLRGDSPSCGSAALAFVRPTDGATIHLEMSATPDATEQRFSGTVRDVTIEVERQAELDRTSAILQYRLDVTSEGVIVLDPDGRVVEANDRAAKILGRPVEVDGNLWHLFPRLIGGPIWTFARDAGATATLRGEGWIPGVGRWLSYSVAQIGGRSVFVFVDRRETFELTAILTETSERSDASLQAAEAFFVEAELTSIGPASRPDAAPRDFLAAPDFRDCIVPQDLDRFDEACRQSLASGNIVQVTLRCLRNGDERLVTLRGRASGPHRFVGIGLTVGPEEIASRASAADERWSGPVTAGQVRAARGLLRWSVRELAERSDVSVATINRFESATKQVTLRDSNLASIEQAFRVEGVEFLRHGAIPAITAEIASDKAA